MINFDVQWPGYADLQKDMVSLEHIDARPLMERWCDIIVEDNRTGVLAGKDGYDNPMPPLKYRDGKGKRTAYRRTPDFGTTLHRATGYGPFATGLHDNLSTDQYQELTGPRLAPRRDLSRVIKNLMTEIRHDPITGTWEAVGAWYAVVDVHGEPFLPFHFDGRGRLPKYDLRHVRPRGLQFAENALRAFVRQLFAERF